jgi:predicted metal-dependent peptidase
MVFSLSLDVAQRRATQAAHGGELENVPVAPATTPTTQASHEIPREVLEKWRKAVEEFKKRLEDALSLIAVGDIVAYNIIKDIQVDATNEVPTAAMTRDGVMLVNPFFFNGLKNDTWRAFVLYHELLHFLFDHPDRQAKFAKRWEAKGVPGEIAVQVYNMVADAKMNNLIPDKFIGRVMRVNNKCIVSATPLRYEVDGKGGELQPVYFYHIANILYPKYGGEKSKEEFYKEFCEEFLKSTVEEITDKILEAYKDEIQGLLNAMRKIELVERGPPCPDCRIPGVRPQQPQPGREPGREGPGDIPVPAEEGIPGWPSSEQPQPGTREPGRGGIPEPIEKGTPRPGWPGSELPPLRETVKEGSLNKGDADADDWKETVKRIIDNAKVLKEIEKRFGVKTIGDVPAGVERYFDYLDPPRVDWRRRLWYSIRAGVGRDVKRVWTRESKKLPGYPGKIFIGPSDIVVLVDTSGSIGEKELRRFVSEIYGIAEDVGARVVVIPWDAQAYPEVFIEHPADVNLLKSGGLKGGGGTIIGPALEKAVLEYPDAAAYVILSDWLIGDLEDPKTRRLLAEIAPRTIAVTTEADPPKNIRFYDVIKIENWD